MKSAILFCLGAGILVAQPQPAPVFRVTVVSRTVKAINYKHRSSTTRIDFRGTELMPKAHGNASVQSRLGSTKVETHLDHLSPANQFGPEYLTYVLWAITPEGRPTNLGEAVLEGDHANLLSTTDLQSFGLIVTAEPYFAVTQPSDVVVAENFVRDDTVGTIEEIDAKYQLLRRGEYVVDRGKYHPVKINPKGPLQLAEAENAIEIANLAGADRYAADTMGKARTDYQNANDFLERSHDRKRSETNAREAAQMAEDARLISVRQIEADQQAAERAAAAERESRARAQAQQATEQARLEQQQRAQAEADRQAAEQAKREAEQARLQAEQARQQAESARAAAIQQQNALKSEAEQARSNAQLAEADRLRAEGERQQAVNEQNQLRERLRQQLNRILETRETARGLIVNINDVLFGFNKASLTPEAREKMAKVAGILLAYPGLKVKLEGHTDNVGSDEYNVKLSERRAEAVRDYLVQQSVPADSVTASGLGKSNPVASNESASGRQQNRRVDMVVSGAPIGVDQSEPATGDDSRAPR